ncbi:F-box/LRR-repeat protein 7-like [Saccostrea cucullata]|uniref:F-box/LRR-repeat protein 7-like n=1 Tax=Saccostrea cuccullata TaxID=36930 RepID=UPI002ED2FCC4
MELCEDVQSRKTQLTNWHGIMSELFGMDRSMTVESTHDSSSGFASDVPSHTCSGINMSNFKENIRTDTGDSPFEMDSQILNAHISPCETKAQKSNRKCPISPKQPNHYNAHDLKMHYRMSTPSPLSYQSSGSFGTPPSFPQKVHKSRSSSSNTTEKSLHYFQMPSHPQTPVVGYKNPAYEYQLDKHMEQIQYNIKRIELQEEGYITKGSKYQHHTPSLFDLITDDIIVQIFSYLSSDQLCRASRVCQRWYRVGWDPLLWKQIVLNSELINVDKAIKYLTKRLSYNTPTVCVIVEKINLNKCEKLTDKGLHTIAKRCPELRQLKMQGCSNVTNHSLFEVVSYCVNLEYLDVTGCPCITCISLTPQIMEQATAHHLRQIYLRTLDMTDCYALEDDGLRVIAKHCIQLQFLYLRRCVRIGDNGLQYIAYYCSELKELSISDCKKVTDFGVCELAKIGTNLRYLSVAKCDKISDVGIIQLCKRCTKLRYLNLRGCEAVSDDSLDVLARNCSKIKSLDIGKCDVTDEGLNVLAQNCPQLKKLSLKSCEAITDNGVKFLAKSCRLLQQFNIQDCHLTVDAYRTIKKYCKSCFIEHTNLGFF